MKKYLVICIILCTFLLAACQVKNPEKSAKPKQSETVRLEKAKNLEVGITYKIGASKNPNAFYVKFIDDQHYVYMNDDSHYTEKKIAERSGDGGYFYPYIYFTEGEYIQEDNNYILKPMRTQKVEFKDAQHVKDSVIANKKFYEETENDSSVTIVKEGSSYIEKSQNRNLPLYEISKNLPNSIDDFLAQYDYQPEELHW